MAVWMRKGVAFTEYVFLFVVNHYLLYWVSVEKHGLIMHKWPPFVSSWKAVPPVHLVTTPSSCNFNSYNFDLTSGRSKHILMPAYAPVSYTHLDVYKRQNLHISVT